MPLKPEYILVGCGVVVVVMFVIVSVVNFQFGLRLSRYEPEVWKELRGPEPYVSRQYAWQATRRFLRARRHLALADERCHVLGERMRVIDRAFLITVAVVTPIAGYIIWFEKP